MRLRMMAVVRSRMLCAAGLAAVIAAGPLFAQAPGGQFPVAPAPAAPTTPMTTPSLPSPASLQQPNPLFGSVPGPGTPGTLNLTIRDALDRGLRYNLGLTISGQGTDLARATRLKALADLLPNIYFRGGETMERVNLSVFGIPLPPGTPNVVGPFSLFDSRAVGTANLFDLNLMNKLRASDQQIKAAQFDYRNMRDVVVLAVGGAYLQTLTDSARVEAAQAQVKTGQRLYQQATDMHNAGVVPSIDVLRAQVEYQIQQQRVVNVQNELDKDKLRLARIIGLPPAQQFTLADTVPYAPAPPLTLDDAIARALHDRPDYQRAQRLLEAAQLEKKAAQEERLPTVQLNGDYGVLGKTPGSAERTYTGTVSLHLPIFQGGRVRGDVLQADTILRQRQAELQDLKARIETDVRTAFLDLSSASQQVQVAKNSVDLAQQTLQEAQDRFSAGVTTNLEVIQAQESIAATNENYIATLFAFNYAKLSLARALGVAEEATKKYLGGNP